MKILQYQDKHFSWLKPKFKPFGLLAEGSSVGGFLAFVFYFKTIKYKIIELFQFLMKRKKKENDAE